MRLDSVRMKLNKDIKALKDTVRKFVDRELIPLERKSMEGLDLKPELRATLEKKARESIAELETRNWSFQKAQRKSKLAAPAFTVAETLVRPPAAARSTRRPRPAATAAGASGGPDHHAPDRASRPCAQGSLHASDCRQPSP